MQLTIRGHDLPGRTFCDDQGNEVGYDNVHVGVQVRTEPTDLVPGDAASATWRVDIDVRPTDDGGLDFRGPAVQGKRGERFVYLTWGTVDDAGTFTMFRRAKLMLGDVDPDVIGKAACTGELVASVGLTDRSGWPLCARVVPPAVTWTAG